MNLIMGLMARIEFTMAGVFDKLEALVRGVWEGTAHEIDGVDNGCYNYVLPAGKFAVRVCRTQTADPSWAYLEYCYKHRHKNALRVYLMGSMFGYRWAIVERLPKSHADLCKERGVADVWRNPMRYQWEDGRLLLEWEELSPGISEFLTAAAPRPGCYVDLHTGNFRYRADGTPVITDPFA